MRKFVAGLIAGVALIAASIVPASAYHSGACNAPSAVIGSTPVTGTVAFGAVKAYQFVVPANKVGIIELLGIVGDVDLNVCKVGTSSTEACISQNPIGVVDSCGGSSTVPNASSGAPLATGTYRVMVLYCLASISCTQAETSSVDAQFVVAGQSA